MISSKGGVQYYSPDMMAIDDDFPDTTLLTDEDIAAILSSTSTSTMFMENNNSSNNNINGGGEGSALDRSISNSIEEEEKKQQQPVIRKRCRASKNTPSTFLIAKASDFRALVQQLTGCQSADSSYKGPINLNFGAAAEDDDTTNHLDTPMLEFKSYDQNSTHPHQEGGQQRLLYEEQESSSNSSSSSSINGGNTFVSSYISTAPGAYYNSSSTTMTRDDYGDNDLGLDDIFMHEYCSFDYGSEYSSAADHVAITTGDDDNYYSPDYIFPADDESNILFCGY